MSSIVLPAVILSPIAESDRSGNPITIKALSREPGNSGWTVYTCVSTKSYMEDLDNDKFQPNQPHDITNDTVAQIGAENRANHDNNVIVHIINNREWTEEQKRKLVEIERQEMRKGKNFMKRVKARWDTEYKKEGWGRPAELENQDKIEVQQQTQVIGEQKRKSIEWTTDMKIFFVMLDEDELVKGRGFMKCVKNRLDIKYPEHESASWQKLGSSAARLKKDQEIKSLILVRRREEVQEVEVTIENNPEEEGNIIEPVNNDEEQQEAVDVEVVENVPINNDEKLSKKDKELEQYFQLEQETLNHSNLLHMKPRKRETSESKIV